MNTKALELFLKIVEQQNFSKAAVLIGTSQPALSRAIRDLEAEWKVTLLHRDGRGVRLTEIGEAFARRAATIVQQVSSLRDEIGALQTKPFSGAHIGIIPSMMRILALPLTNALQELYPGTRIRMTEASSGHLMEWLDDGRIDVALMYNTPALRRLHPEPVMNLNLYLVGAKGAQQLPAELPFKQLSGRPLILASRANGNRRELEKIARQHRMQLDVSIEIDSLATLLRLVEAGYGYSILPSFTVRDELERGSLEGARLVQPALERQLVLVAAPGRSLAQPVEKILRVIKTEARKAEAALMARSKAPLQ